MGNMSYCRFENTSRDLNDCSEALQEMTFGDGSPLDQYELPAAKSMTRTMLEFLSALHNFKAPSQSFGDWIESAMNDSDVTDQVWDSLNGACANEDDEDDC